MVSLVCDYLRRAMRSMIIQYLALILPQKRCTINLHNYTNHITAACLTIYVEFIFLLYAHIKMQSYYQIIGTTSACNEYVICAVEFSIERSLYFTTCNQALELRIESADGV